MNPSFQMDFPRLSKKEMIALDLLVNQGEMYGVEMVENSGGELKRGTVYVTLQRMADKGWVESREVPREPPEIGIPRRIFRVTGLGQRAYKANLKASEVFNAGLAWGGIR